MIVLSLFDGISGAKVAFERAGIPITKYYASEIDKKAITISSKNHPSIVQLGDVSGVKPFQIDVLIGGSPCQDLSIAKKDRQGLKGDRSCLFWQYVRLKNECNPKWFVFENVASMSAEDRMIISKELGVEPVLFNASLVSAQNRKRYFWTNIKFSLPSDKGIVIKDIMENITDEGVIDNLKFHETDKNDGNIKSKSMVKVGYIGEGTQYGQGGQAHRVYGSNGKTPTLSSFAP